LRGALEDRAVAVEHLAADAEVLGAPDDGRGAAFAADVDVLVAIDSDDTEGAARSERKAERPFAPARSPPPGPKLPGAQRSSPSTAAPGDRPAMSRVTP
jgi:hypothetical protein